MICCILGFGSQKIHSEDIDAAFFLVDQEIEHGADIINIDPTASSITLMLAHHLIKQQDGSSGYQINLFMQYPHSLKGEEHDILKSLYACSNRKECFIEVINGGSQENELLHAHHLLLNADRVIILTDAIPELYSQIVTRNGISLRHLHSI